MKRDLDTTFFAMNHHTKTATLLTGFACWELVQGAFRCGLRLPDGTDANGIGRHRSEQTFRSQARRCGYTVI